MDAVARHLSRRNFDRFRHIYVIGAGKAGASMAQAAERILGSRITAGLINVKDGHVAKLRRIELNQCGHPVPDERGAAGSARIAQIAAAAGPRDLVICLVSGGASALLPLPAEGITLEEKQATTRLLLACGATIHQINAVRKHISRIKGGQLARLAAPARVEALLLSDVIGDDLDVIGSGPTAPDASTFAGAAAILDHYAIRQRVPASVRNRIERGMRGEIPETPKPADPLFSRVRNTVVGGNRLALDAAARAARQLGYRTLILSSTIEGETREIARMHAAIARVLEKRFREYLKHSALEEIRRVRTDQIARMLVETELPVGQIAETLGFEDVQHVARYFRAGKGLSPLAYRKMHGRKHAGKPHS